MRRVKIAERSAQHAPPGSIAHYVLAQQMQEFKSVGLLDSFDINSGLATARFIENEFDPWEADDLNIAKTELRINLDAETTMVLRPGVVLVIGPTTTGKTLFTRGILAERADADYISFREHEHGSWVDEGALINGILHSDKQIIIADSIKYAFYSGKGALGDGGVNMTLYSLLSTWNRIASAFGKIIVFVINPLTTKEEAYDSYFSASKGSVSTVIQTLNVSNGAAKIKYAHDFSDARQIINLSYSIAGVEFGRPSHVKAKDAVLQPKLAHDVEGQGFLSEDEVEDGEVSVADDVKKMPKNESTEWYAPYSGQSKKKKEEGKKETYAERNSRSAEAKAAYDYILS